MVSRRYSVLPVLVIAAVFLCFIPKSSAAKKPDPVTRKNDIPFIKCGVCEEMAKHLTRQVKKKKDEIAPKKITELQIIEITEKICDMKKNEGEWISTIDIVEDGDKLKLDEMSSPGECNSECRTVERTCTEVLGDHDTDIAEALYKNDLSRSALSQLLCRKMTKSCVGKVPPVPKDRVKGEEFVPIDAEKAKMDRVLRDMNVKSSVFHDTKDEDIPNAPKMKMYSRDDLMNGVPGMKTVGGEDEEDEEDEKEL